MIHSVFWSIESFSNPRLMSQIDQVSQFGSDVAAMNRIFGHQLNSTRSSLYIMDSWGAGTLVEDRNVIIGGAIEYLSRNSSILTLVTSNDPLLTEYLFRIQNPFKFNIDFWISNDKFQFHRIKRISDFNLSKDYTWLENFRKTGLSNQIVKDAISIGNII